MAQQANHALPPGFQLNEYRIEHQLSLGGFSIVYLATDAQNQFVAIKEYLPNSLALRAEGEIKPLITEEHMPAFRYGMKCFFEEGRALAKLSHPNVIRVLNFFRANDTVYMVMEYEHGRTMQEFIQKNRAVITENFMRNVFTKLLNGLREVHSNKLLHLDIKPSNIYMRNDYAPVLIDFGAARQTLASDTPMLKPMYTPGFASPEHYNRRELLGPWSDLYSIGACMYACLAACAPQAADGRMEKDKLVPALARWKDQYSTQLLETIDWCLCLNHLERPQSAFTLAEGPDSQGTQAQGTENDLARPCGRPFQRKVRGIVKFTIYQESRPGKRSNNEDRLAHCYSRDALLMVVADGMGGHYYGEIAAQIAVQTLVESFQHVANPTITDPFLFLQDSMLNAHRAIVDFSNAHRLKDSPRTTCVACIVQHNIAYWAHSGDSRLYLMRNGRVIAHTRDHSRVQLLLDQGVINEAQAALHPERNKIYSCLGGPVMPEIEFSRKTPLEAGDVIVLCTDGLWGVIPDELMATSLKSDNLMQAVPTLLNQADSRGGPGADNLSIMAVRWEDSYIEVDAGTSSVVSTQTMSRDTVTTKLDAFGRNPSYKTELSEEEIERAIEEIRSTIQKYSK